MVCDLHKDLEESIRGIESSLTRIDMQYHNIRDLLESTRLVMSDLQSIQRDIISRTRTLSAPKANNFPPLLDNTPIVPPKDHRAMFALKISVPAAALISAIALLIKYIGRA